MRETGRNGFKKQLVDILYKCFPGCYILRLDPNDKQGIPDLLILYKNKWAALECKRNINAHRQPNQEYYILEMNKMSYASFVYPENLEEVINELYKAFGT